MSPTQPPAACPSPWVRSLRDGEPGTWEDLTRELEPPLRSLDFYAVLARDLDGVQRARGERWWDEMARLRELPPYRPDWGSATTR